MGTSEIGKTSCTWYSNCIEYPVFFAQDGQGLC
jgi:hypothetical protein